MSTGEVITQVCWTEWWETEEGPPLQQKVWLIQTHTLTHKRRQTSTQTHTDRRERESVNRRETDRKYEPIQEDWRTMTVHLNSNFES